MRSATRGFAILICVLSLFTACGQAQADPLVVRSAGTTTPDPVRRPGDPCDVGDAPCWRAHIEQRRNERIWWLEVRAQQIRERDYLRTLQFAAAVEAARIERQNLGGYPAPRPIGGGLLMGSGRCGPGYGLPPCWRLQTESRGIINVYYGGKPYRTHSCCSASGKWAFIDGTWKGHRGYRTAASAPEWVQDEKARQVWDGGRGCSNWSACGRR